MDGFELEEGPDPDDILLQGEPEMLALQEEEEEYEAELAAAEAAAAASAKVKYLVLFACFDVCETDRRRLDARRRSFWGGGVRSGQRGQWETPKVLRRFSCFIVRAVDNFVWKKQASHIRLMMESMDCR